MAHQGPLPSCGPAPVHVLPWHNFNSLKLLLLLLPLLLNAPAAATAAAAAATCTMPPSSWSCNVLTDEAVKRQRLRKNEDEDHAHEQLGLLRVGPARSHGCKHGRWSELGLCSFAVVRLLPGGKRQGPRAGAAFQCRPQCMPVTIGCNLAARGPTHLTPASPTMPMAMPAARPARPQDRPDDRCAKPSNSVYLVGETAGVDG